MNLLMGIGQPDSGTASLLDHDIVKNEVDVKRRVAYVSPDLSYRTWGTVGRAIDFVSGFYPDWNDERCERLQYQFGVHRSERDRRVVVRLAGEARGHHGAVTRCGGAAPRRAHCGARPPRAHRALRRVAEVHAG